MSRCDSKFQYTAVGKTFQGSDKCVKECAGYSKSGVYIENDKRDGGLIEIGKRSHDDLFKPSPLNGQAIGAGYESLEGCIAGCHSRFQSTGVGKTSQGSKECEKGCVRAFGSGAVVTNNKREETEAVVERTSNERENAYFPKGPAIGAGYGSAEGCAEADYAAGQFTGVGKTGQGNGGFKEGCFAAEGSGAEIWNPKRDVDAQDATTSTTAIEEQESEQEDFDGAELVARKNKNTHPYPQVVGAGSVEYMACMASCSRRFQGTGVTNSYQGKSHCENGCVYGAGSGVGISNKRDFVPVSFEA
ncbi:hypothetical protein F5Y08DRAFT_323877 [Xylaria arbuscula]|nr:hypothetical protein F5Y08DRAFT_323877 [Xylaria arbuscula]